MDLYTSPQGEYGRLEQILSHFLVKSLHIILDSRVPSSQLHGRNTDKLVKKSDKWFSLVLGDRPPALDNLNFWHKSLTEPIIIDIVLVQETPNLSGDLNSSSGLGKFVETVIERWVVQYEHTRIMSPQNGESSALYKKTYKKSIILLRSLYSMMRLLPAHQAFRKVCSVSKVCDFEINYKVSSFCAPFSREEEKSMKQYKFTPVDAHQGQISVSLTYREDLSDFNLETPTLFPPQIITDYVGSPATDPLRSFPTSVKGFSPTSVPVRGIQSPTSTPFQRPHSWTSGLHRGPHQMVSNHHNLPGGSPHGYSSSLKNEFSSSPTDIYAGGYANHNQNYKMGNRVNRGIVFEDNQLSPPFSPSPSPSPSPPAYLSGGNFPVPGRRRSETAPVSIPHPMMAHSPRYLSPNLSDPSRHSLPPQSPKSKV
jgi:autophagy-related protein 13